MPDFNGVLLSDKIKLYNNYELYNMFKEVIEIKKVPVLEKLNLSLAFKKIIDMNFVHKQRNNFQSETVKNLNLIRNNYWKEFLIYVRTIIFYST